MGFIARWRLGLWLAAACLLLPLGSIAQTPASGGDAVREIRIEGTQRIEPATARSYLTIHLGDKFDPEKMDESLKALYATGLFADVVLRRDGNALVVRVVENPVINRVAFEGNKKIEDKQLNDEIQLKPRTVYSRTKVQQDVKRILEVYRRSGRFSATVEPKVITLPENRVDLVYEIDEGDKTKVTRISFIGNHVFSDGRLREVDPDGRERLVEILHQQRYLRPRPADLRPRALEEVLSRERLCRLPRRLGRRRARA